MLAHRPDPRAVGGGQYSGEERTGLSIGTVVATPTAVDAIMRLRVRHHAIAFRHSVACRDCDIPDFVTEAELPPGLNDLQLGEIGGVPFLIDADQYKCWGCPDLVVDVAEGDDEPPPVEGDGGSCLTLRASRRAAPRDGSLRP